MSIRFSEFELTNDGDLRRGGAAVHLQPQPLKVLSLLVARAGTLVTREEIQRHVWGEETFVDFDQGLNWCIRRIREVLGDDAAAPRFIETVPRRGYRFIATINVGRASARPRTLAIAIVLLLVFLITGVRSAPRVSVLVLPFDDLGGASQTVDVATNEIIGSLAQIDPAQLAVIDPLTARKFKNTRECIRVLGRQLDTQYVMVGAVRRSGERLRVTAQLFRVADNRQEWAASRELPANEDPAPACARLAASMAAKLGISSQFNRS